MTNRFPHIKKYQFHRRRSLTARAAFTSVAVERRNANLMELRLCGSHHFQWDNCQDPKRVWMKWKKDEVEGESVEKKDSTFVFRIKGTNYEAISGSEMYVIQQMRNLDLQLYKDDELINGVWCVDNQTTKGENFSLDFSKVDTLNISVKDSFGVKLANFKLNIYAKPEVKFELLPSYKGEFGFDNYFEKFPVLLSNGNYRTFKKMGTLINIPWLTISPNQKDVNLKLKFNIPNDMCKDINAFIKIETSNINLQFDMPSTRTNIIDKKMLEKKSLLINIYTLNYVDNNNYLYMIDNSNDTIAKLAILCQEKNSTKKLHIYEFSDNFLSFGQNFRFDYSLFNQKAYNQAFLEWDIDYKKKKIAGSYFYNQQPSLNPNNRTNNRYLIPGIIRSILLSDKSNPIDIDDIQHNPNDYYLFLIPVNYFEQKGVNFDFYGFCREINNTTPIKFSHQTYLSIGNISEKIGIHEVGHSLGLYHIFENPYNITQGTTNNYMDYSFPNMISFWVHQWLIINNKIK